MPERRPVRRPYKKPGFTEEPKRVSPEEFEQLWATEITGRIKRFKENVKNKDELINVLRIALSREPNHVAQKLLAKELNILEGREPEQIPIKDGKKHDENKKGKKETQSGRQSINVNVSNLIEKGKIIEAVNEMLTQGLHNELYDFLDTRADLLENHGRPTVASWYEGTAVLFQDAIERSYENGKTEEAQTNKKIAVKCLNRAIKLYAKHLTKEEQRLPPKVRIGFVEQIKELNKWKKLILNGEQELPDDDMYFDNFQS